MRKRSSRQRCSSCILIFAGVFGAFFLPGCQGKLFSRYQRDLAPTLDRLVAAYPDLATTRRFDIIADFEKPEQASLFRIETRDGTAAVGTVAITTEQAQRETGVGSLRVTLPNSSQQLVAADLPDSQWTLYRDWSRHQLLILSVESPRPLFGLHFAVRSGTDQPLTYEQRNISLAAGWNLLRIDLAEIAEQINITDVREIRFWCDPLESAVDLYLDDMILVDNTQQVLQPADAEPGNLYVRSQGRRLVVGSSERFELVFSRGQIVQWFDLGTDAARLHNLVSGGSLGPRPTVLGSLNPTSATDTTEAWAVLGNNVEAYQSLTEASALRVIVDGQWRFGSSGNPPSDASPQHRWTYSIYADGRVYCECAGTARTDSFQPTEIGMSFSCDAEQGFVANNFADSRQATQKADEGQAADCTLLARTESGRADLLIVPAVSYAQDWLKNTREHRMGVCYHLPTGSDEFHFAGLLRVWPTDVDSLQQAASLAGDYRQPLPITVDTGTLLRTDTGDLNNDGFNESRGYYVVQLDGNFAKLRINGRDRLRFSPVFKLADVIARDVWIYMDGKQIKDSVRDPRGDVLFMVPGVITREVLIEITSRAKENP